MTSSRFRSSLIYNRSISTLRPSHSASDILLPDDMTVNWMVTEVEVFTSVWRVLCRDIWKIIDVLAFREEIATLDKKRKLGLRTDGGEGRQM